MPLQFRSMRESDGFDLGNTQDGVGPDIKVGYSLLTTAAIAI